MNKDNTKDTENLIITQETLDNLDYSVLVKHIYGDELTEKDKESLQEIKRVHALLFEQHMKIKQIKDDNGGK